MCTIQLSLNDSLLTQVQPTFPTKEAVGLWLQEQATMLLQQLAGQQPQTVPADINYACIQSGVLQVSEDIEDDLRHAMSEQAEGKTLTFEGFKREFAQWLDE